VGPAGATLPRLAFTLRVSDFASCGVVLRNGFVSLRVGSRERIITFLWQIWFPKLRHVVMMSDQEVNSDGSLAAISIVTRLSSCASRLSRSY
jgi:hypothetical protein